MNPEEILALAEKAIAQRNKNMVPPFVLCDITGELACIPAKNIKIGHVVFLKFNLHRLTFGLTSAEWHNLSVELARFYNERGLCPKLHKQ